MTETEVIKQYGITQRFETARGIESFAGSVFAKSQNEAEHLAELMGAECDGEIVQTECHGCEHTEFFNGHSADDILNTEVFE